MASRGVNKVILVGNLGLDPEARMTAQGAAITKISIATDESHIDKQTGQIVPKTEWHRVVLFNRLAEISRDYLKKGAKVYIEGRLNTRKWKDKDGQDRYSTEIVGSELQMLSTRGDIETSDPVVNSYHDEATQGKIGATVVADFDDVPF